MFSFVTLPGKQEVRPKTNYEGRVYPQWLLSLDIYLTLQSKTHWVDRTGHW